MYSILSLSSRLEEARPAAVGVELGLGVEQLGAAHDAVVGAGLVGVPVLAGERPLGAGLLRDVELHRSQLELELLGARDRARAVALAGLVVCVTHVTQPAVIRADNTAIVPPRSVGGTPDGESSPVRGIDPVRTVPHPMTTAAFRPAGLSQITIIAVIPAVAAWCLLVARLGSSTMFAAVALVPAGVAALVDLESQRIPDELVVAHPLAELRRTRVGCGACRLGGARRGGDGHSAADGPPHRSACDRVRRRQARCSARRRSRSGRRAARSAWR